MAKRKSRKSDAGGKKSFTVDAIQKTEINEIAIKYWAPYSQKHLPFDVKIVQHLYTNELLGSLFSHNKVVLLEFSQYLEAFLWPNYDPATSPNDHLLSIVAMVNEKYRERVPAWGCFVRDPEKFNGFFRKVLEAALDEKEELAKVEQSLVLTFLVHCFNSVEVDVVRAAVQRLAALPCWINLLPTQRDDQFAQNTKLKKFWQIIQKHDARLDKDQLEVADFERRFLWRLVHKFFDVLDEIPLDGEVDMLAVHYCERSLELMIDLEALLPTRRFFNALLDASHAITRCTLSALIRREEGTLFCELLQMLRFYARFEIDDVTGQQLTEGQMTDRHYAHVTSLQKAAFKHFKNSMRDFYLLNVGGVDTRKALVKLFNSMGKEDLYKFAEYMHMVPSLTDSPENFEEMSHDFLTEMLVARCERRPNQLQQLNELPLYPTEAIIWDENMVPYEHYNGEGVLALNKLNLQFLTLHDYLLRNFTLFQMESTYEIRKDLEDSILRMKPWLHENGRDVVWGGWARMAQPILSFTIVEVSKPNIGEKCPSSVRADITVHLGKRADIRHEWEGLRKHDVGFLVTCRPTKPVGTKFDIRLPFKEQFQVAYVRGCEIEGMLDGQGRVIEEFGSEPRPMIPGDARSFRVWLDTNQYRADMEKHVATQNEDLYETFNLFVRRDAKSNNFKAVLDTMRQLLNTECVVPDWLHDLILGYGEPDAAHYSKMPNTVASIDFNDTFVNYQHLLSAFPEHTVVPTVTDPELLVPPFRLTFKELEPQHGVEPEKRDKSIVVEPHVIPSRGPYPYSEPKMNAIRFTPAQVEAIKSGMEPGLTMVVGPPGTGKTDVAVQIISNIYHNWPEQRTLIVTHSNQALNQLFEKIMALDIDERHLLRLGHGEEALETTKDFSRYGRVNYVLAQRLELLKEVERLQQSLGVVGDVAYTCETAGHFYLYQVYARWEEFEQATKKKPKLPMPSVEAVAINFPFSGFFDSAPQPLFKGVSYEEDWAIAQGCWRHIRRIFDELEEFRAFELLRSGRDRTEYLLVKEAKIIAMTCTHSALRRKELVELGFRYDNILMEESAQILEVETFIPLLLQNPQDGHNRLKRWIMIGDHHQLPPVIQNMAFQKYSNMEQSLFARFVRLGVPTVLLDAQGRARSSIAQLYNWRYRRLGNLPHVAARAQFQQANSGFVFDYQLIDVQDFNGAGETTPSPYFYQNLGEAEYAVAIFMYMRILGYPPDKISMITTYNGQAQLIRDVVERRCASNPLFGRPHKISTVDKFQGQQNDYIILSLVRTKAVGHLRDVRRLIVALSRARLGLFVLGRVSLFANCFELTPAFNILCQRPQKLLIVPNEPFPTVRQLTEAPPMEPIEIQDAVHMGQFVHQFYTQNFEVMRSTYQEQMKDFIAAQKESAAALAAMQVGLEDKKEEVVAKPAEDEEEAEKEIAFEVIDSSEPAPGV